MFQYTTETIISSNDGALKIGGEKLRFAAVKMTDGAMVKVETPIASASASANASHLIVDGVGLYKAENITEVYKRNYVAPKNEKVTIKNAAVSSVTAGTVYRLRVDLYQEGLVSSTYADAQLKHYKPFFYEVVAATTSVADLYGAFVDVIKKEMSTTDFNYFEADVVSTDLVLNAKDCYTRFKAVRIDTVPIETVNTNNLGNVITGFEDFVLVAEWDRYNVANANVALVPGTEGQGTVARLIKNLRVPTDANTDMFGIDNGGKPVPGGKYTQYTIEYVTDRRHIGGQVLGALDKSITTHIFFIESAIVADFEKALLAIHYVPNTEGVIDENAISVEGAATDVKTPTIGSKQ